MSLGPVVLHIFLILSVSKGNYENNSSNSVNVFMIGRSVCRSFVQSVV